MHLIAASARTGRDAATYMLGAKTLQCLTTDAHGTGLHVVRLPDKQRDTVQEKMKSAETLESVGDDIESVAAAWEKGMGGRPVVRPECKLNELQQQLHNYSPVNNAVLGVYLSGHGFLVGAHRLFALCDGVVDVDALERYLVQRPGFDSVLLLDCCDVGAPPLPRGVECNEAIHVTVAAAAHGLTTMEKQFRVPLVKAMNAVAAGSGVALSDVVALIRSEQSRTVVTSEDKVLLCMAHALPMRAVQRDAAWQERRAVAHALFKQYQGTGTVDLSTVCRGDWRGAVAQAAMGRRACWEAAMSIREYSGVFLPGLPRRRAFVGRSSALNKFVLPRGHESINDDVKRADVDLLARHMASPRGPVAFFAVLAAKSGACVCDDEDNDDEATCVRPPNGVGKTALALEAVHRLVERGLVERVLWCDATSPATLEASLRAARDELGMPDVRSLWERSGRWLLVLDGADFEVGAVTMDDVFGSDTALSSALVHAGYHTLEDVLDLTDAEVGHVTKDTGLAARLMHEVHTLRSRPRSATAEMHRVRDALPSSGHGCVLVTSRRTDLGELHTDMTHVLLDPLDADAFLEQLCEQPHNGTRAATADAETDARRRTAVQLHRLPLAMELAAAYVRQGGTFVKWARTFVEQCGVVVGTEHEGEEVSVGDMVQAAFETCMALLEEDGDTHRHVMHVLAVCAPDAIPLEIVKVGCGHGVSAEGVLRTLSRAALVHYDDTRQVAYMHRLMQQAVCDSLLRCHRDPAHVRVEVAALLVRAWPQSKDPEARLFPHAMHVLASCHAEKDEMLTLAMQCAAVLRGRGADCVRVQRHIVHLVNAITTTERAEVLAQEMMLGVELCRVGQLGDGYAVLERTVHAMEEAAPHKDLAVARIALTIARARTLLPRSPHKRADTTFDVVDAAFAKALRMLRAFDTADDARVRRAIESVTAKRVRAREAWLPADDARIAEARVERTLAEVDVLAGNVAAEPDDVEIARVMLLHAHERLRDLRGPRVDEKRRELMSSHCVDSLFQPA